MVNFAREIDVSVNSPVWKLPLERGADNRMSVTKMPARQRCFQCRSCGYTFEMLPCASGKHGQDIRCPSCGGRLKRIDKNPCIGSCSQEQCKVCGMCQE
ncbi:Uncharacterised protein [uncultured archaeon]|nr:Uncharacterised protein [uncultured archaeon]